jgi:hypothetical protein
MVALRIFRSCVQARLTAKHHSSATRHFSERSALAGQGGPEDLVDDPDRQGPALARGGPRSARPILEDAQATNLFSRADQTPVTRQAIQSLILGGASAARQQAGPL